MDLDAIAVFVKVVQAGSFSGAARLLGMPKTTVSARVAALEKRLGVTLIVRTTRKLHLTGAGEEYYRHCANAVQEVELAEAALRSSQDRPSGILRVTAPVDIGHTLLPRIARAYLEKYPDTGIELLVTNRVVDIVGEGIDLAIRAGTLKDSTLVARRFFGLSGQLWSSPAYVRETGALRKPEDVAQRRVIVFAGARELRLTDGKRTVAVPIGGRVAADDFETVKALVALGEGIAWMPDFLAEEAAAAGALVPALPGWRLALDGACYFVHPGGRYPSPKVQAFMEVAFEVASQCPGD